MINIDEWRPVNNGVSTFLYILLGENESYFFDSYFYCLKKGGIGSSHFFNYNVSSV